MSLYSVRCIRFVVNAETLDMAGTCADAMARALRERWPDTRPKVLYGIWSQVDLLVDNNTPLEDVRALLASMAAAHGASVEERQ